MRRYNRVTNINEGAFFRGIKKKLTISFEDGIELSNNGLVNHFNSLFSSNYIEMSTLLNGKEVLHSTLKDFNYNYEQDLIKIQNSGNLTNLKVNGTDVSKVSVMVNPNDSEYAKILRGDEDEIVNFNTAEIHHIDILYKNSNMMIRLKNKKTLDFLCI